MLLLGLLAGLALCESEFDRLLTLFLGAALLLEAGVLLAGRRRSWCGALALEELLALSWLGAPFLDGLVQGWRLGVFCAAAALGAALLLRVPLPEPLFPLRGAWLRRLLAAVTVAGLLAAGPWQYAWEYAWRTARPTSAAHWLLLAHLCLGGWALLRAASFLVAGVRVPRPGLRPAPETRG
jgi:hypothetical protein